jgi:PAS domain S-box-containing protein
VTDPARSVPANAGAPSAPASRPSSKILFAAAGVGVAASIIAATQMTERIAGSPLIANAVEAAILAAVAMLAFLLGHAGVVIGERRGRVLAASVSVGSLTALATLMASVMTRGLQDLAPALAPVISVFAVAAASGAAMHWSILVTGADRDHDDARSGRRVVMTAGAAVFAVIMAMQTCSSTAVMRDQVEADVFAELLALGDRQRLDSLEIWREVSNPDRSSGRGGRSRTETTTALDRLRSGGARIADLVDDLGIGDDIAGDGMPLMTVLDMAARKRLVLVGGAEAYFRGETGRAEAIQTAVIDYLALHSRYDEALHDAYARHREDAHDWARFWLGFSLIVFASLGVTVLRPVADIVGNQERALAERARDHERMALVVRHTRNAVVICDQDRRIVWVNAAFEDLTGWTFAEVEGKSPGALLQCEQTDRDTVRRIRAALELGEGIRTEILNRGKSGRLYWVDMDIQPERDASGRIVGYVAIESEVTEQARLRQYLRLVVDSASAGIVVFDNAGRIIDMNPEAERISATARADLVGRSVASAGWSTLRPDGSPLRPDDTPAAITLRTGVPQTGVVIGLDTPDGVRRWLLVNARREIDPQTSGFVVIASFVNITAERERERHVSAARERAERALAELETYRSAIDQHGMVMATDADGVVTFVNDAFCRGSGWPREEIVGQKASVLASGVHDAAHFAALWETVAAGGSWRGEICNRGRDGQCYWIDATIVPRRAARGGIDGFVSVSYDITERLRAERALRESEAKFRALFEVAPIGLARHRRADGVVLDVNPMLETIAGRGRDAMVGHPVATVLSAGAPTIATAEARPVALGPSECEVHRPDGSTVPVLVSGVVTTTADDEATVWSFVQDISARKAVELSVLESRRRLDAVIQATGIGLWEWHLDTGAMHVDERWAAIIGREASALSGADTEAWKTLVHPDDLVACRSEYERYLAGEVPAYAVDMRMRHANGHWVWVHTRGGIIRRDGDGRPLLMVGTHQDVTDRRIAEEALRRTNAQIQAMIDNAPGGITFVDRDLNMLSCNERYRELLDLPDSLFENGMPN